MADDLKRVGVVFTAEGAADFKKSLQNVNSSITENIAAYKLAQSQWDKNTKSSEKLADKQRFLAQQTEDYKTKVLVLNRELQEMENAENRDESAINKKKAQLAQAQTQLNRYEASLEEVNNQLKSGAAKMQDYAESLNDTGKKLEEFGGKMTNRVTKPVVAAGAAAMAAWAQVDNGLDIVTQKTGASGEALEEMHQTVKDLCAEINTDFETAGTAVGEVNTRFHLTGEALNDLSAKYIKFAQVNDLDVNAQIDKGSKLMQAYGMSVDEVSLFLDHLNVVGQNTGANLDTLQDQMIANSAALKEMGLDAFGSAAFLGQLETSGIDSGTALAGLKKALQNAVKEGKPMSTAMQELQEKMANAGSNTEAMQLAMELFGNKAGPAIAKACSDGSLSFETLSAAAQESAGSVDGMYEALKDPTDDFQRALNQLMVLGYEIAETLMPMIAQAVEIILPVLSGLVDAWNGLSPEMQNFIVKAALAAAACGPIVSGIGGIIGQNGIGGLMMNISKLMGSNDSLMANAGKLFSGIKAGAGGLFSFLAANPVIAIIMGIVAVIAILYAKCEWFRDGVNNFIGGAIAKFNEMKDAAGRTFNGAKETIEKVVNKLKGIFNFEWKLPKLKLPHLNIKGEFSLVPPRAPSFSLDWYAKGGILTKPTIFGAQGSKLLGGGEAGHEAVLPISLLKDYIHEENNTQLREMYDIFKRAIVEALREIGPGIWLDDRKIGELFSRKVKEVLFNV